MPRKSPPLLALLMGDVVGPGAAKDATILARRFHKAIRSANDTFAAALRSPLTITLGDEFQGIAASLADAFEIARHLSFRLREQRIGCRFAIGLGEVATPIHRKIAGEMFGSGLSEVRRLLTELRHPNRYRFQVPEAELQPLLNGIGYALTEIEGMWTERQFAIVQASERQEAAGTATDQQLAKRLGISKTALYKHRKAAHYRLYGELEGAMALTLRELDARHIKSDSKRR